MTHLHIDFETRCLLNIKAVGLDRYARAATPLMLAWAIDDSEPRLWLPPEPMPRYLFDELMDPTCVKVAWNHQFERSIFRYALHINIPNSQWLDPGVLARYAGVAGTAGGGSLDFACGVFKLPVTETKRAKDGKRLIKLFCTPNKKGEFNSHLTHPDEWDQFCGYCRQDVIAERAVLKKVERAFALPPAERALWLLDSKINELGMPVDMTFVQNAAVLTDRERAKLMNELHELTGCENPNSRDQLLKWLQTQGYPYKSLGKKWVSKALEA